MEGVGGDTKDEMMVRENKVRRKDSYAPWRVN